MSMLSSKDAISGPPCADCMSLMEQYLYLWNNTYTYQVRVAQIVCLLDLRNNTYTYGTILTLMEQYLYIPGPRFADCMSPTWLAPRGRHKLRKCWCPYPSGVRPLETPDSLVYVKIKIKIK